MDLWQVNRGSNIACPFASSVWLSSRFAFTLTSKELNDGILQACVEWKYGINDGGPACVVASVGSDSLHLVSLDGVACEFPLCDAV